MNKEKPLQKNLNILNQNYGTIPDRCRESSWSETWSSAQHWRTCSWGPTRRSAAGSGQTCGSADITDPRLLHTTSFQSTNSHKQYCVASIPWCGSRSRSGFSIRKRKGIRFTISTYVDIFCSFLAKILKDIFALCLWLIYGLGSGWHWPLNDLLKKKTLEVLSLGQRNHNSHVDRVVR